jgi:hypothetical protein
MSGFQKDKCAKGTLSVALADLALRQPDNLLSGDNTDRLCERKFLKLVRMGRFAKRLYIHASRLNSPYL